MKKLLLALVIVAAPAMAAPYGEAGCGLGSQLMGAQGNQVFAATTNGTFGTQTFGISFGTSNCVDGSGSQARAMDNYIEVNQVALASEASRGAGPTIASLSQVMGCDDSAAVGRVMQQNYSTLFPSADVAPAAISETLRTLRTSNTALAQACAS